MGTAGSASHDVARNIRQRPYLAVTAAAAAAAAATAPAAMVFHAGVAAEQPSQACSSGRHRGEEPERSEKKAPDGRSDAHVVVPRPFGRA